MKKQRHELNDRALELIRACIEHARGSQSKFSRMTGIPRQALSKILSGKVSYLYEDNWNKLVDFIPELERRPPTYHINGNGNAVDHSEIHSGLDFQRLMSRILALDIDAESKVKVLQAIEQERNEK